MGNAQKNPAQAADGHDGWPDWNSQNGTGVEAPEDDKGDFAELYKSGKKGAVERQADKNEPR